MVPESSTSDDWYIDSGHCYPAAAASLAAGVLVKQCSAWAESLAFVCCCGLVQRWEDWLVWIGAGIAGLLIRPFDLDSGCVVPGSDGCSCRLVAAVVVAVVVAGGFVAS